MPSNTYDIYARTFAKVASGAKVTDADFGGPRLRRFLRPLDQASHVATALAVQDVSKDAGLRSKAEFQTELHRLLA